MLKNFLKVTFRRLQKERQYALLNLFGLALGMASGLLIIGYVIHESTYDLEHPDIERLYRVNMTNIWMPGGGEWGSTSPPLAEVLLNDYADIEAVLRINTPGGNIIRSANEAAEKAFYETNILAADSGFFDFFNFELLHGHPDKALREVNQVVISKEMAIKYFGNENAVGEILLFGQEKRAVEVTGVTSDQPVNQHFDFDFLISMPTNPHFQNIEDTWIATQVVTYVKTTQGADVETLEGDMSGIAPKYAGAQLASWNMDYDKFMTGKGDWLFYLQPVADIYLGSGTIGNRIGKTSDYTYMVIFSLTAAFILALAVINFINLTTARAALRSKEVGVRKVLGSNRKSLILQILYESVLMCILAGIMALGLAEFMKIGIDNLIGSSFEILNWHNPASYLIFLGSLILIGLIAGIYPSLYLTAFAPGRVLKGELTKGHKSQWFRNGLVVLQFTISTVLIICTVVAYQQLNYFQNKDLGYSKDNVIVINWAEKLGSGIEAFRDKLIDHPKVEHASISLDVIGRGSYEDVFRDKESGLEQSIAMLKADQYQLETMGLNLKYGRFFTGSNEADKTSVVINESTMKLFGYTPENVLGQTIIYGGDDMGPATVIGVVEDFHFYTLHYPIGPYLFYHIDAGMWGSNRVVAIRTDGEDPGGLLNDIQREWNSMVDVPFDYSFLDVEYENQYEGEARLSFLFTVFTLIAIFVACLGLFGLAAFIAEQKQKEIGIRKTLGASVFNIIFNLNVKFTKLILLSILVAMPVAWWASDNWLSQFEYRVELVWPVFILSGMAAVCICWLTVSYQSIKAATSNPVESLRNE